MCSYNFYVVAQENLSLFILILKNAAELFYCKKFFKPAASKNPNSQLPHNDKQPQNNQKHCDAFVN